MPSNAGSRHILVYENLLQFGGVEPGERRRNLSNREQKSRDVLRFVQQSLVEIVAPAIVDDTPFAEVAVKLEFLERQDFQLTKEIFFVTRCEDIIAVLESFRQRWQRRRRRRRRHRTEQIDLIFWHPALDRRKRGRNSQVVGASARPRAVTRPFRLP